MRQLHALLRPRAFAVVIAIIAASPANAEEKFFDWHTTNVQLLRGHDYELGSKDRTIMTVEHANGWKYGDTHFFLDQTWPDEGTPTYYFEPTVRLSFSKMTGKNFSYGIIKDVLLSSNFEKPKGQKVRLLGGFAIDLDVPGFKFLKTNYFVRNNQDLRGQTYQVTVVWNRPVQIGNLNFLLEGFADFAGSEGTTNSHQLIVPRFLLDVGEIADIGKDRLWMGIEWQYWHNKYGRKGVTESVPQLQVKWVF